MSILFCLDWDDTILPTSWLARNNYINRNGISSEKSLFPNEFGLYIESVGNMLNTLNQIGKITIVSGSMYPWVYDSKSLLDSQTEDLIDNVQIYHTRNKTETIINMIQTENISNLIMIGDGSDEINTHFNIVNNNPDFYCKLIRLVSYPDLYSLIQELNIISSVINDLIYTDRHVSYFMKKQRNGRQRNRIMLLSNTPF